ncbi:MAG: DNA gyrase inhibitor YacG [Pseudomonadota bacterium]|nr:DNA gyrase inhibitor YacG [Pseudomonadota bacterium]
MPAAKPESPFAEKPAGASRRPCPICGKPAVFATRPFCSKRCADVDLHRWLGGVYAIPAAPESDAESDGAGKQAKIPER